LIVGVDHDDYIRPVPEGFFVTGFLVRPISPVFCMDESIYPKGPGHFCGIVPGGIVDQDYLVDIFMR